MKGVTMEERTSSHEAVWIVVALALGVLLGFLAAGRSYGADPTKTGEVTYTSTRGTVVCVRPEGERRVCGQYVEGTGGPQWGTLHTGDRIRFRLLTRNVGGAELRIVVAMA